MLSKVGGSAGGSAGGATAALHKSGESGRLWELWERMGESMQAQLSGLSLEEKIRRAMQQVDDDDERANQVRSVTNDLDEENADTHPAGNSLQALESPDTGTLAYEEAFEF